MTRNQGNLWTRPVLTATEAQLYVADVAAACGFYVKALGFTVAFAYGDPPHYAQVGREQARLNLRLIREAVFTGDIREREQLLSASLTTASADELKQLFAIYHDAGVPFLQGLKQEPWGATTFIVRDPDGNLILFSGPA